MIVPRVPRIPVLLLPGFYTINAIILYHCSTFVNIKKPTLVQLATKLQTSWFTNFSINVFFLY